MVMNPSLTEQPSCSRLSQEPAVNVNTEELADTGQVELKVYITVLLPMRLVRLLKVWVLEAVLIHPFKVKEAEQEQGPFCAVMHVAEKHRL